MCHHFPLCGRYIMSLNKQLIYRIDPSIMLETDDNFEHS